MELHPCSYGKCKEKLKNFGQSNHKGIFFVRMSNYQAVGVVAAPVKPKHIFPQYHKGSESFFSIHSSFMVPKGSILKVSKCHKEQSFLSR